MRRVTLLTLLVTACDAPPVGPHAAPASDATALPEAGPAADMTPPPEPLVALSVGASSVRLLPGVRVDGAWQGAGSDGPCARRDARTVVCPVSGGGLVSATRDGEVVRVRAEVEVPEVEALALVGEGELPGATGWISSGLQSWSQAGVLALGPPTDDATLMQALAATGDLEVVRRGTELSWWHLAVGGGPQTFAAAAVELDAWPAWATVGRVDADRVRIRLVTGMTREPLPPGEVVAAWWLGLCADEPTLAAMGDALPSRRWDHPVPAEAGWNSWYELWDGVDEEAVRANAALAREALAHRLPGGAPPLRITVDDGWQQAWGDWRPNAKFPSGLSGLATDLKADGFVMGVWLAPLLVQADQPLVAEHPEWFVAGLTWTHLKNGPMRVLDATHPGAAEHLAGVVRALVGWGYDFLKIDFLFAGLMPGRRHAGTAMQGYLTSLRVIREAAGDDVVLLAVGAPGPPSLPYVDAWRVGGDIAVEPLDVSYPFVPNQLRSVAARWPLCRATLCDADPVVLRGLAPNHVAMSAWVVATAGGALFLSDDLRALPDERYALGLDGGVVPLSVTGRPAVPLDLFPADPPSALTSALSDHLGDAHRQFVPTRWRLQDGRTLRVNSLGEAADIDGVGVPAESVHVSE